MSLWTEETVTSAYLGITTPIADLYSEITRQGWQVQKVEPPKKDGQFKATATSPHGEKQQAEGRTAADAVSGLLMRIMRLNFMRSASRREAAGWNLNWVDKMPELAQAYAKAPIYDPKATPCWIELAQDSVRRAQVLGTQLKIEVVDNPEPYETPQQMCEDVHKNKHFYVSRANSQHPVWTVDQNVAFRIVHDVMGHCVSGGDFGWAGECHACAAHFPLLSPNAQKALMVECIMQTAYAGNFRSFGPQKVFLPESVIGEQFNEAQARENGAGHAGLHPSQTVAPIGMPQVAPSLEPEGYGGQPEETIAPHMEGLGLTPVMTRRMASVGGSDINAGWSSGVEPLPNNAFQWQGDPLDAHNDGGMMDTAGKVNTGWHGYMNPDGSPDLATAKAAIINAFRVVLLSPRKDLKWNAIHYQHIQNVPADCDDPKRYWDTLENQRENWNQSRGHAPGSHKPYWKAQRDFTAYVRASNPELGEHEVHEMAAREWQHIWSDEEERIAADPKNQKLSADEIERKVAKDIERRILTIIKPTSNEKTDVPHDQMSMFGAVNPGQIDLEGNEAGKYGAWMGSHLKAISQISAHADEITKAALDDVHDHDGQGHHFRAAVLSLGISGVGPKVCSFAWLLLQPLTSQLATIDTHMMDVLGHDYDKEMSPRDYFKFERQLAAGRDAAGYGHVPLGAFQWGIWDHKRNGPGQHQDHSAMRVLDPVPHDQIDWNDKAATNLKGADWASQAPDWWKQTEPARQQVGDDWDATVATRFPRSEIPFAQAPMAVTAAAPPDEFCAAFQIPEHVKQTIANWASTLDWPEDSELDDPQEYHCTVLYAHGGYSDDDHHKWIRQYALNNVPMDAWKLELFGPNKDTVVLRLKSEQADKWATRLMDEAEERGLDVSRFPGGYKPHVTIGKATELPKGDRLDLSFRSGPLFLYAPRALQEETDVLKQSIASTGRAPYFLDQTGGVVEGQPDQSVMHHLRSTLGLSTQEIWNQEHEVGKR